MQLYKNGYFVPALSLALFAAMFMFGPGSVTWFWADQAIVAAVLAATSIVLWVVLFFSQRQRSQLWMAIAGMPMCLQPARAA